MARNEESTTKFKVDISDFKKSMQEASRLTKLAQSEFNAATAGMGKWSESVDGVSAKLKQLGTVLTAQKRQLATLEEEYARVVKEQGAESKGATELMIKINNQTAAVKKTEAEMSHYSDVLDNLQKETLELGDDTVEAGKDAKKGAEGFTVMKGALADLVASGIKAAIKGLKDLGKEAMQAYKEFDEGRDKVIKATGATGEAAEQLVDSYKKVAGSIKGDFSSLGSTLGEINTRMGLTGKALENATVDFTKFADVTGTDATEAVRLVTRAMNNAGIDLSNYNEVLDELALSSQASGISVDTLAENLTKFGAPMRALGLDTKDSIALFSSWEKAGMNTSVAFSGLQKAVGNWSKEGKNAKKEFAKVIKDIKNAPSATKATERAIEAFGKKAGPELADAIQGGRFEYEKFVDLLQGSEGTVRKTYDETQDGFDKVQLAIQKGRTKLASALDTVLKKYGPEITAFINGAVDKLETLFDVVGKGFKFIMDNKDTVLSALAGIATAFVTYKTVTTITAVVSAFQGLIAAIKAGESAMAALNVTMSASPIGLLAAAFAGGEVALAAYIESEKEAARAQYKLNEEQQKAIDNSKALADEYAEIDKRRAESNEAITSEYKYLKDLKDEYNSLVDSNGKIKEGYESRADFILNQLAEAMGVERAEIDKTIKKNGKLGKSIDDLMIKQQGKALLDSNQQFYNDAIAGRTEALETYQQALTTVEERERSLARAMDEAGLTAEQWKQYQNAVANNDITTQLAFQKGAGVEALEALKQAQESYDSAAEGLKNAENAYVDMYQTIDNYEGLSAALLEGDAKKIQKSMELLTNNYITADKGNARVLEEQEKRFEEHYYSLRQAVADGMAGVTEEDVQRSAKLVEKANNELVKYFKKSDIYQQAKDSGLRIPDSISSGIYAGIIKVDDAMQGIENLLTYQSGATGTGIAATAKNLGLEIPENVAQGIISGQMDIREADKQMYDTITKALEDVAKDAGIKAEDIPENIRHAVLEGDMGIGEAIATIKGTVEDGLDETKTDEKGKSLVDTFADAIEGAKDDAYDAAKTVADKAAEALDDADTETSGENFTQGFINGIKGIVDSVKDTAAGIAQAALKALKEAQQEGSPSKLTTQSGIYFTEGYINGMKKLSNKVAETAADIAKTAVKNLKLGKSMDLSTDFEREAELVVLKLEAAADRQIEAYDKSIDKLEKKRDKEADSIDKYYDKLIKQENQKKEKLQNEAKTATNNQLKAYDQNAETLKKKREQDVEATKDYYDNLIDQEKKAKAKLKKSSKDVTDEQLEAYDLRVENLKKQKEQAVEATKTNYDKLIEDEKSKKESFQKYADKTTDSQVKAIEKNIEKLEKQRNKELTASKKHYTKLINSETKSKEQFQKASSSILSDFSSAMRTYAQEAEELITSTIDGVTERYNARVEKLTEKQESLAEKMKAASDLFEVSGAGVLKINDLTEQTRQIEDYANNLLTIKRKVSTELFDQLTSYDMKEGSAFISQLLQMSDEELKAYDQAYVNKLAATESLSEKIYSKDFKRAKKTYKTELEQALAGLPEALEELGRDTMQAFIKGLTEDTQYMSKAVKSMVKQVTDSFKAEKKTTTLLQDFGSNFKKVTQDVMQAVSTKIDLGEIPKVYTPTTATATGSSTVVNNNYNLVQNNSSPKSLSALETYTARRQQLAMLKALQ